MFSDWYSYLKQKASDAGTWLINTDAAIFGKVASALPSQTLGPAGALVKAGGQISNQVTRGNAAPGITLGSTFLDNLFNLPDSSSGSSVLDAIGASAQLDQTSSPSSGMFADTQKPAGQPPGAASTDLPFWVKTAIFSALIIGTVLIVKGAFEHA